MKTVFFLKMPDLILDDNVEISPFGNAFQRKKVTAAQRISLLTVKYQSDYQIHYHHPKPGGNLNF